MSKFLVVDDHPLARAAIRYILEHKKHEVIAESDDGQETLELVVKLKPDILILDININTMNGLDVINALRKMKNSIPIIVMSGKNSDYYASISARRGANGFISKRNSLSELTTAIDTVLNGCGYFPLRINYDGITENQLNDASKIKLLSRREIQVLEYLSQNMDLIDIAKEMEISNKTVSTYKIRLMDKLGLKSRSELYDFIRTNYMY